jgi:L-lactate utilization protein LutB
MASLTRMNSVDFAASDTDPAIYKVAKQVVETAACNLVWLIFNKCLKKQDVEVLDLDLMTRVVDALEANHRAHLLSPALGLLVEERKRVAQTFLDTDCRCSVQLARLALLLTSS